MNKVVIFSVLGLGALIAAGFLIKVSITSAPTGSLAAKWVTNHPSAIPTGGGFASIPIIIKLLSKGTT
jgi:hypothetical protein